MTPELALFAIKALIRVGQQANKALVEYAADQGAAFPDVIEFKLRTPHMALTAVLRLPAYASLRTQPPFDGMWLAAGDRIDPQKWSNKSAAERSAAFDKVAAAAAGDTSALAELVLDEAQRAPGNDEHRIGLAIVNQWDDGTNALMPFGRVILAIAEVALEYVSIDPSIVGVRGSRGEKILKSFATAISTPLTNALNAETLGPASQFFDAMLKALSGAAFDAFRANVGVLISDQKLATLVGNVLDPVVTAVKTGDVPFQRRMQNVFDALLGPAAEAAMRTVASDPAAFFGTNFDKSKAAGALVSALLVQAAHDGDVRAVFSQHGVLSETSLIALLTSVLDVAAKNPEYFIQIDDQQKATLAKDVIGSVATAIKAEVAQLPSTRTLNPQQFAAKIAAAAITAVGQNAAAVVGHSGQQWHDVATDLTKKILGDFGSALNDPNAGQALQKLLSEDELVELGRIAIEGVATNPGMVGAKDADVRAVISAVATAMAADKRLLLTPDDWLGLARVMVKQIAEHPSIVAGSNQRLQGVVQALGDVIAADTNSVLTKDDVLAVAQAFTVELTGNPVMFAGLKPELAIVVQAVAKAMALDAHRLLAGQDWVQILQVATTAAAENPARLFGLNYNNAGQALAADVIGLVLKNVPATLPPPGGPHILKSDIVRESMLILLKYLSQCPDKAKNYMPLIQSAVKDSADFVAANAGTFGGKDLLDLLRALCANIVADKYDTQLAQLVAGKAANLVPTAQDAKRLLAEART